MAVQCCKDDGCTTAPGVCIPDGRPAGGDGPIGVCARGVSSCHGPLMAEGTGVVERKLRRGSMRWDRSGVSAPLILRGGTETEAGGSGAGGGRATVACNERRIWSTSRKGEMLALPGACRTRIGDSARGVVSVPASGSVIRTGSQRNDLRRPLLTDKR